MRMFLTILMLFALVGCSSDIIEPTATSSSEVPAITPPITSDVAELWVIVAADGSQRTFTSEAELWDALDVAMRPAADPDSWLGGQNAFDGPQSECWHWTFDSGTWWVRHCGYTLAEECYYFQGPTGQMAECGDLSPGGNW